MVLTINACPAKRMHGEYRRASYQSDVIPVQRNNSLYRVQNTVVLGCPEWDWLRDPAGKGAGHRCC